MMTKKLILIAVFMTVSPIAVMADERPESLNMSALVIDEGEAATATPDTDNPMQQQGMKHRGGRGHMHGKGGMKHEGGRHRKGMHDQQQHQQVVHRLDMIEARLAKIEAMLEILLRR